MANATTTPEVKTVRFLSVEDFNEEIGSKVTNIMRGEESGKLFFITKDGRSWKCKQDLDFNAPLSIAIGSEHANFSDNVCMINDKRKAAVVKSF